MGKAGGVKPMSQVAVEQHQRGCVFGVATSNVRTISPNCLAPTQRGKVIKLRAQPPFHVFVKPSHGTPELFRDASNGRSNLEHLGILDRKFFNCLDTADFFLERPPVDFAHMQAWSNASLVTEQPHQRKRKEAKKRRTLRYWKGTTNGSQTR